MKQLILLLLVLVPALIYLGYALASGPTGERLKRAPWVWLIAAGFVLYGAALAVWALTGDPAGGDYVPPRLIDGEIVPHDHLPEPADSDADPAGDDAGAGN